MAKINLLGYENRSVKLKASVIFLTYIYYTPSADDRAHEHVENYEFLLHRYNNIIINIIYII